MKLDHLFCILWTYADICCPLFIGQDHCFTGFFLNAYWNRATNTVSLELHSFHLFRATALHFMRQCCGINICDHVFAYIYVFIKLCVCLCCHVYLSVWLDWRLQGTVLRTQVPVPGSTFSTMTNGCSSSVATVRWRSSDTCSRKLPYRGQIG